MVAVQVVGGWVLWGFAVFLVYLFLSGLPWGAGYSPTSKRQLEAAAVLLQLKEGDTVYDLGSGFGRALIFFAKEHRVRAIGAEVDPLRKAISAWSAKRRGVSTRVTVLRKNLLDLDLHDSRKVFFFLSPLLMRKLQEKLQRELPPGALVASVEHQFPDWRPEESLEDVHLYVVRPLPTQPRPPTPHDKDSASKISFSTASTSLSGLQSSWNGLRTVEHVSASSSTYLFAS